MNLFWKPKKKCVGKRRKNVNLIQELATLFREHGDMILEGKASFSLNTASLTCLNEGLSKILDEESHLSFDVVQIGNSDVSILQDLQLLYDYVQKVIALKLIHGNATLQGRVNICRFRALKILELKKIPIHLVIGLQGLRPKLETITCSRSLQNPQVLFSSCGGDMTQPYTWPELKYVNLSYNGIEELDESLKLIPYLEMLNLSHNNLKKVEHLDYSTVLKRLCVSFNCLSFAPVLSLSARSSLLTLNMSYNNLETLKGIEELYALENLDVSGNCLVDHSTLQRIMFLKRLKSLDLTENPLSYHKRHREFTIGYLHPETSKLKFMLDGKSLNKQEQALVRKTRVFSISRRFTDDDTNSIEGANSSRSETIECSLEVESEDLSGSKRSKGRSKKAAVFESSVSLENSPMVRRKIKKVSRVREAVILDPSELQNLAAPSGSVEKDGAIESHLETKRKVADAREKFGSGWLVASQDLGVAAQRVPFFNYESESDNRSSSENLTLESGIESSAKNVCQQSSTASNAKDVRRNERSDDVYRNADEIGIDDENLLDDDEGVLDDGHLYVIHTDNDEDEATHIISIGSRYITEKDCLTGKVIEVLDLQSLSRIEHISETNDALILIFDHIKKTKRKRTYFFDNDEELNELKSLLDPYVQTKILKEISKGALQCLKCAVQFYKNSAVMKVKNLEGTPAKNQAYPSSYDSSGGYLAEVPTCPNCDSEMIVEMDHSPDESAPKRKASTPLSSSAPRSSFLSKFDTSSCSDGSVSEKVDRVLKDDAVIYSSSLNKKVEIEVMAEVYHHQPPPSSDRVISDDTRANAIFDDGPENFRNFERTDSDISLLSNPSQSSISVISQENSADLDAVEKSGDESTVKSTMSSASSDSLNGSECTAVERSVYDSVSSELKNSVNDSTTAYHTPAANGDESSDDNSNSVDASQTESMDGNSSSQNPCTDIDYRAKLHLSMTLFGKDEDFRGLVHGGVVQYQKLPVELRGCVVLTNVAVYLMKVEGELDVQNPQKYFQKFESRRLKHLKHLTTLLNRQGFLMEFVDKGKQHVYSVLVRDSNTCRHFLELFTDLSTEDFSNNEDVVKSAEDETLLRINEQILNDADENIKSPVRLYVMGEWSSEDGEAGVPVSFVVTSDDVIVAAENFRWPVPYCQRSSDPPKHQQFTTLAREKIINLTDVKLTSTNGIRAEFLFSDEDTSVDSIWNVTMTTATSLRSLITALRTPWEELFGVELNVTIRSNDETSS